MTKDEGLLKLRRDVQCNNDESLAPTEKEEGAKMPPRAAKSKTASVPTVAAPAGVPVASGGEPSAAASLTPPTSPVLSPASPAAPSMPIVTAPSPFVRKRPRTSGGGTPKGSPHIKGPQPVQFCTYLYALDGGLVSDSFESGQPCFVAMIKQLGSKGHPAVTFQIRTHLDLYLRAQHLVDPQGPETMADLVPWLTSGPSF